MLSDAASRCGSPRPPGPNTLAVPSPSPVRQKSNKSVRKAAWGKFIRKTSEQMLGIPGLTKVNNITQLYTKLYRRQHCYFYHSIEAHGCQFRPSNTYKALVKYNLILMHVLPQNSPEVQVEEVEGSDSKNIIKLIKDYKQEVGKYRVSCLSFKILINRSNKIWKISKTK